MKLLLLILSFNLFAADTVTAPLNSGKAYFTDSLNNLMPLFVGYSTDGDGHLHLLNSPDAVDDDISIPANTGKMYLNAADGNQYPAMVLYTTDGNGHAIPIPSGGGGGTWGSITGTLSDQLDLQSALDAKQSLIAAGTTSQYYRGDKTFQTLNSTAVGLGNVNNTSDASKPISTATQAVLDLKAPLADSSTYRVGPGRQYTTIQAALNAIGNSTSSADSASPKLVSIAGGVYDEDLVIPLGRILTLQAEGTVILGNGAGSNWSSTNSRSISADYNTADVFTSGVRPALNLIALPGSDATSTFIAHAGVWNISGGITLTGALTRSLNLSSVKINGILADASAGLTNLQAYRSLFIGAVNMGAVAILERCYDCEFDALLTVNSFNAILNSEIKAGMTVTANSNTLPPSGMFFTTFTGTFTGPASSLKLDLTSDYFFRTNSASLGGSATKVLLASSSSASITGPLSSTDWSTFNSKFTLPSFASGSVPFSNGTSLLEDNINFFFDNTNHSLSVGPGPHPATSADLAISSQASDTKVGLSVFTTSSNNAIQISSQNAFSMAALTASNTNSPSFNFERSRGTLVSKSQVLAGDILGSFVFNGYTGSADGSFAAAFGSIATENQASGHAGANITFQTTPNGSATLVPRLVIDQDGSIVPFTTASNAIGRNNLKFKDAHFSDVLQIGVRGSGSTPTCAAADDGTIALTNGHILCVCNGSSWVQPIIGLTACTF